MKARNDVSGDRSIDMFASEINSNGPAKEVNLTDTSAIMAAKANQAMMEKRKTRNDRHSHRATESFQQSGFDLVPRIYDERQSKTNQSMMDM